MRPYDRAPLSRLELLDGFPSPPKRTIKISNHKFPRDFFNPKNQHKLHSSTSIVRNESDMPVTRQYTPQVELSKYEGVRRENVTPRDVRSREEDLIMGVISSAREMKRVIRKHSIELKKENKPKREDLAVELPPLLIKRGVTTAL